MLLSLVTGCGPDRANEVRHDDPAPPGPVVADFSGADPEVGVALEGLLDKARAEPAWASHRGTLGMAYEVNGFAAAALESYRQAEAMDPLEPRWPYFQALLVAHRGELDQALADLDRSISLDGDYGPAWLWRGTWLLDQNRLTASKAAFERAAELASGLPASAGLARVALRRDRPGQALDILQPLAAVPDAYIHHLIGQAYRQLGKPELAREALQKVTGPAQVVWPDPRSREKRQFELSIGATLERARVQILAGEPGSALALIEPLRSQYPAHQGLISALAEAYRRAGRGDEALAVLVQGIELHPDFYGFHLNIADHYHRRGEPSLAMAHLDRAIELNPQVGWAHAQRGLILVNDGRVREGLASFQEALQQDPDNPQVHYYVGMVHASAGNWQNAIAAFRGAVTLDPAFGLAQLALGRSLTRVGDYEGARVAIERAGQLSVPAEQVRAATDTLARHRDASP